LFQSTAACADLATNGLFLTLIIDGNTQKSAFNATGRLAETIQILNLAFNSSDATRRN